ncbi:CBS domain-containing protein [Desulfospira joergensenii]|uniref:CBS domain-containing protein n=1 Tax=Desulfospira joergensenii TaxID=53329 RepID=UPI0003B6ACAA|nr:CBS domain-containing protein [Desulfospira joergensenii]
MKVKALLEDGKGGFHTIAPDQNVDQAVKLMSGYHVSALMVMDGDQSCGVFTERDLVRSHILFPGKEICDIPIRDVMTDKLIVAEPRDTLEDAMGMMIKAGIRHLPVVEDGKIVSVMALEDLVKKHVKVLTRELHYLKDYISDLQDAAHD